jgi:hypothetical protein
MEPSFSPMRSVECRMVCRSLVDPKEFERHSISVPRVGSHFSEKDADAERPDCTSLANRSEDADGIAANDVLFLRNRRSWTARSRFARMIP